MYNFQYNTIRRDITIPEYGRHLQDMVDYATTIEDKEERQKVAEEIVKIMLSMTESDSSMADRLSKAWKHIFFMSEEKLDVEVPSNVEVSQTEELFVHEPIGYPQMDIPFKHYGLNVQKMLTKAKGIENLEHRAEYVKLIGSYMKMSYRTWHKEQFVNDETIKNDIEAMTKGEIKAVLEDAQFDALKHTPPRRKAKPHHSGRGRSTRRRHRN